MTIAVDRLGVDRLGGVDDLEASLAHVRPQLVEDLAALEGDICVVGAAGKLGPSLVALACRGVAAAGTGARVSAVSRFSTPGSAERMRDVGADVIRADVATEAGLAALPDAAHVVFLVGAKFGTQGNESQTWATNCYLPGRIAERYAGARIAALSTGNVYHLRALAEGGSVETDEPAPVGDYAMSCLGRERILTHMSRTHDTPMSIIRLNYAVEMRYGVLVDVATAVRDGRPVDVTMGFANVVWQGYANEVVLRSLRHADTPPYLLNLTGPETVSIRRVAERMGRRLGREPQLVGTEADTALLSDATRCMSTYGYPSVDLGAVIDATADWVAAERPLLGKPTHFQTRDGRF